MKAKIVKRVAAVVAVLIITISALTGCATLDRGMTDLKSNLGNGLYRTITVYTADGEIIAQYEGKIDIAESEGGYIKFDYKGKRYIYYNCFVETIADK